MPLLLFGFCAFTNGGEKKKSDSIKFDMTYLEKTWGIKYKSHSVEDYEIARETVKALKILLEFTKDVDNPKEIRRAFLYPMPLKGDTPIYLWFFFFDEDNVSLGKLCPTQVQGELSGKKGDAFRVILTRYPPFQKVRKVEARPGVVEKDKSNKDK
jgi:hypothetical protein